MNHDFYSPIWTDYRGGLAANVAAAAKAVVAAVDRVFGRLQAAQFDAPWQRKRHDTRFSAFR